MRIREVLIQYIAAHDPAFSEDELKSVPFATLVLMKSRIEAEMEFQPAHPNEPLTLEKLN